VDADPVAATGSITFFDPDFGEIRTAEIAASNVGVPGRSRAAAR
jgi:hypothetical protein